MKLRYSDINVRGSSSGKSSDAINWVKVMYMLVGLFVIVMILPALFQLFKGSSTFAQSLVDTMNRFSNFLGFGKDKDTADATQNEKGSGREVLWGSSFSSGYRAENSVYGFNDIFYSESDFDLATFLSQCDKENVPSALMNDDYQVRSFALTAYLFKTGWTAYERYSLLNSVTFFDYLKHACLSKFQFKFFCAFFNRVAILSGSTCTDVSGYLSFSEHFLGFIPYGFVSDSQIAKMDAYVRSLPDTVDEDPNDDSSIFQ